MADIEDIGPPFRVYVIVMLVVTITALLLRFLSRSLVSFSRHMRRFWWDDWMALVAGVLIVLQLALELVLIEHGFGRHVWTLTPDDALLVTKLIFAGDFIFDVALSFTKLSALLFYSRVFPIYANAKWFNMTMWITHSFNIAWLIGIIFGTIFICDPVEKNWNPSLPGSCKPATPVYVGSAISSVFIDLIILILPLPKIWGLQTSTARKVGTTLVFVLAYGIIVASLGRMVTVVMSGQVLDTDPTYAGIGVFYWASAELPISILCICLPAMLPLGRHISREYIESLASKVSLFMSTHSSRDASRDRTRRFIDSEEGRRGIRLGSNNPSKSNQAQQRDLEDSRQQILNLSVFQDNYSAHVQKASGMELREDVTSQHTIRVDNDITVSLGDD
ncbi:hypothetical protein GGR52DRAFT_566223 [Hypoxylon sp. FL1284]|nr:hypothetical protein GGR52DRAFT_566223 [Hypoxylon sp. FL1284]